MKDRLNRAIPIQTVITGIVDRLEQFSQEARALDENLGKGDETQMEFQSDKFKLIDLVRGDAGEEYLREFDPGVVVLVETRIRGSKADKFIHMTIPFPDLVDDFCFTAVFESPQRIRRKDLWVGLNHITESIQSPWLIAGDFNVMLNADEKKGGQEIQKALERFYFKNLVKVEKELWIELENILDSEELLWKQKSRSNWLAKGDRNTKYFQCRATARRRKNQIKALKFSDRNWCYEEERLQLEVVNYFQNLYTIDAPSIGRFPIRERFPMIDLDMMEAMGRSLTGEEVRTTLFKMTPLKSPRVDGLHAQFYQTQWNIVGESLVDMIRRVFNGGDIEPFF
ncbi:hypothetical protein J1N35_043511 [Gossypium stocksii]|uniref:Endonuclease/exonuclease/phosphatase domain-containing protein n=1 Tax=Gossypium stocksii TaxID=47602 RepID=A0A9D3U7K8_9ROSI|nr:hypothetical protein J1N35_043511 [Gossypium stocksii]